MNNLVLNQRRHWLIGGLWLAVVACQPRPAQVQQWQRWRQLDETLRSSNEALLLRNYGQVKDIESQVVKNRNQPADLAVLRQAEALHDSTRALIGALQTLAGQLREQTGNRSLFERPDAHRQAAALLQVHGPALNQRLRRHDQHARRVAALAAPDTSRPAPAFRLRPEAPVVEVLALLAERETRVLLRERQVLGRLPPIVGAPVMPETLRVLATAERSTVAPGDTYRARLQLAVALAPTKYLRMTANGQPVTVGPDGHGQVAFVVPRQAAAGPATWTATIRLTNNGRDTTFRTRIPYTILPLRR